MTPDTKAELRRVGGTVAVIGAALAVGILATPSFKTVRLEWTVNHPPGEVVTEVWTATNLPGPWYHFADVAGSNLTVAATSPAAFFIIRNRRVSDGAVSPWNQ